MQKSLLFALMLTAGVCVSAPAMAHCGTCGVEAPHDHAAEGEKQCPPGCTMECCAGKAEKAA